MTVAKRHEGQPVRLREGVPELAKPVQMQFDPKGRLWVAVWPTYPHWKPKEPMNDKILILEDTDGDGKADKMTVFADHLHCPTGFEFYNGGVLVAQAPDLCSSRTPRAPARPTCACACWQGLDSADTHHTSNSFVLDPGGAVYFQEGTFHHTQVETPYGPPLRCVNAGVFRYEPRTQKFEVYVTYGFANPHGHVFDRWGQDIVYDGTGANPYHAALFSGHVEYPEQAPHGRRRSTSSGPGPAPAWKSSPAGTSRPRTRATCWSPTSSASRASCNTRWRTRAPASRASRSSRSCPSSDPNFRPVGHQDRPRRRHLGSSTGTTRSSATCSTTSAIPAATAPTAGSTASPTRAGRC